MADHHDTTSVPIPPAGPSDAALLVAFECHLKAAEDGLAAYERDCAAESDATYDMRDFLDDHGRRLLRLARAGVRT